MAHEDVKPALPQHSSQKRSAISNEHVVNMLEQIHFAPENCLPKRVNMANYGKALFLSSKQADREKGPNICEHHGSAFPGTLPPFTLVFS
jgi:hypothetical protein